MREFGSAVILAGGKSTRMGFDKQLLSCSRKPLIEVQLSLLRQHFDDIMIVTDTPYFPYGEDVRFISDIFPNMGPLGGIHTALRNATSEAVFVIACDMPRLDIHYIDYMISRIKGQVYDACVTANVQRYQSFHSFYYRSALPTIEMDLSANKASMFYLLKKVNTLVISEEEAAQHITVSQLFLNLNTREDYWQFLHKERANI